MSDDPFIDLQAILPPLLGSLEALGFAQRVFNRGNLPEVLEAIGAPDESLSAAVSAMDAWPEHLAGLHTRLAAAEQAARFGLENLRGGAGEQDGGMRGAFRAFGQLTKAYEALYPLTLGLPPVSRFFLSPARRNDTDLLRQLVEAQPQDNTGLFHVGSEPGARGSFSAYVPEYYTPDDAWPLVVALHGGAGNGANFLWSWLRDARAYGAILIAPTAVGETWALQGIDRDTPNLNRILELAHANWNIDPERILLTGMSDGGTFSYVTGLEPESPFTHLAPCSAAFHPMLAKAADAERMQGLPIHITHGSLDWMFEVDMAREAARALQAAGAQITYREFEDLAHTYPREVNPAVLKWLMTTDR